MEAHILDWSLRAILMAAGTAAVLFVLRVRSASAKHIAWTGFLIAMLLLPVLTTWGPMTPVRVPSVVRERLMPEVTTPERTLMWQASQGAEDNRAPDHSAAHLSREAEPPGLGKNWMWNWKWVALICYSIGFGLLAIRLATGILHARTMTRQAYYVNG